MQRGTLRTFGTILLAANALIAFLSLANLFLVAAGAISVEVPDADDVDYFYDTANRSMDIDTSFRVRNAGIYSVRNLDIASSLVTDTGYLLLRFDQEDLEVPAGESRTFPIKVRFDLSRLASQEVLRLLVNDGELELRVHIQADYTMGLTKFRSDETIRYQWTSPLALMRGLLESGNLSRALETALGWAGPIVRQWLGSVVIDAAMAPGEWRHESIGSWADLDYRLSLNETTGEGSLDAVLSGDVAGWAWSVSGSVPLRLIDGQVYLEREVMSDAA
jgi:hypothetical protein